MNKTKIRWSDSTWNVMTGCSEVSEECDRCYARTIAESPRFAKGFPNGFEPTFKPERLGLPKSWREPRRVFVNSMSDVHHEAFTDEQVDAVYDAMAETDRHDYLVLTKRPQRMARFFLGSDAGRQSSRGRSPGWLERRGLDRVPDHIWLGTSIGLSKYVWRANWLRMIPVTVRFLSLEPLLGPLPNLDLDGIAWVIVGGESGSGYRPMDPEWARDLRDRCDEAGIAFYVKQDAAFRTETRPDFLGDLYEQYPLPHPAILVGPRAVGVYVDEPVSA